jgi:NADPH:quinone reductase-like Zn-dependent oxidoreductase
MKAVRIHSFGAPDVMVLEDVPCPRPDTDEVLLRVAAAGVGPWDAWVREGKSVLPQPLPLTPGADVSGKVVGVGTRVADVSLGEDLFGVTNPRFTGGYAEYAVVKAAMAAKRPQRLSDVDAAAAPVVAVTAWQMLFDHAAVQRAQRVLVLGAAGGVGACAVQLAIQAGAEVVGAERGGSEEYVRSLGARAVDAAAPDFERLVEPVDVVVDTVGGPLQARAVAALKPGGVLVSSVSELDGREAAAAGIRSEFILVDVNTRTLIRIGELMEKGRLAVRVGAVLPLAEARLAHQMLSGGHARPPGKIVLAVQNKNPGHPGTAR